MNIEDFFEQYRADCEACNGGKPVCIPQPDAENGFQESVVMFINERPGRLGAGKSGKISFENNDPTALWFRELFALTGLDRKEIFITNRPKPGAGASRVQPQNTETQNPVA